MPHGLPFNQYGSLGERKPTLAKALPLNVIFSTINDLKTTYPTA
jgi:hypothetical protein